MRLISQTVPLKACAVASTGRKPAAWDVKWGQHTLMAAGSWGRRETGAGVYHPVITVTAVLTVLLRNTPANIIEIIVCAIIIF